MKLNLKEKFSNLDILSYLNLDRFFNQNFTLKKTFTVSMIIASFICSIVFINMASASNKSKASIIKKSIAQSETALNKIIYEGEEMYVASATLYDYYSDSQISAASTPEDITDALNGEKNTFSKFNKKLIALKKYNIASECPAKYPLYQGRPGALSDMDGICYPSDENLYKGNNYWAAANWGQVSAVATQGLVDKKLSYDSNGNSYITQSNPGNNKSTRLPFFDKEFLTTNKHENSELPLGAVYENISFPFRRVDKDGTIYYEFYSSKDTVRLNSSGKLDYLGYNKTSEQVKDAEGNYGFFPYNSASDGKSSKLNFGQGVKIEVPFNMTKDGKINNKDMVFSFSGDDDVWVFIDGILALDIGGNHGEVSGTINFASGEAIVSKVKNNKVAFAKHSLSSFKEGSNTLTDLGISNELGIYKDFKTPFTDELKNKLKNTANTHTLTLYYMERGLNVANMKMNFNLPEPTVLNVTNTIKTNNVGNTFKDETNNVASKDSFLYDVSDRTMNRTESIDLMNKEAVTFSNEFDKKDAILVQQKGLKISSRKLTELYSTSWNLTDTSEEISKGTNLLVTDTRSSVEKTFLFANKSGDETPVLTANYVNEPQLGDFKLECYVDDDYQKKHSNYKEQTFIYTIKYSNIFGGDLKSTSYIGKYIHYTSNDASQELTTNNGKIALKPGEKFVIKSIPVQTKIYITVSLNNNASIKKVQATENFKATLKDNICTGTIVEGTNIMKYTISEKSEKKKENLVSIPASKKPTKKDPTKELEDVADKDAFDDSPTTADESRVNIWITLAIISLFMCMSSFIYLYKTERHNTFYNHK